MSSASHLVTGDLCDANKANSDGSFRVLPPVFRSFGKRVRFAGVIATVKCFEDNSLVKAALESPGDGRVLVVDGGGSLRRALVGGNIAAAAAKNGWAGVVVDGCVRDSAELIECDLGIRAIALVPMPTERRNQGERDVPVQVAGVWVLPGEWLVADEDGIVVMPRAG
ncbi:MAG: ribonuclease E activity regulator RraA [Rhizobiales bacterium]|nr:ribonuclease E activity regulator RraA [Rhizobacter sp.]